MLWTILRIYCSDVTSPNVAVRDVIELYFFQYFRSNMLPISVLIELYKPFLVGELNEFFSS